MTNEELFTDLKQFVAATVSQEVGDLRHEMGSLRQELKADIAGLKTDIERLERRFDDVDEQLNEIQNAIGAELEATNDKLKDHERRLYRLEHRSA